MSKRLICLALCLIMLTGVLLTSCGDKTIEDTKEETMEEASQSAVTLRLCLMTEKPVVNDPNDDEDSYDIVVKAINAITKKRFKTQLQIEFWTYDRYYRNLDQLFAKRDEAVAKGTVSADKEAADVYDADGFIVYPSITDYQIDIFYLGGEDMYDKYRDAGRLKRINDQITTAADINTNIPPQFLNNMTVLDKDKEANRDKSIQGKQGAYAISMSKPIGTYTYLMLNKEALKAAYRDEADESAYAKKYTSLTCEDVQDFLEFVTKKSNGLSDNFYPIYTNFSENELLISKLKYWGIDDAEELVYWGEDENGDLMKIFSVLGGYYDDNKDYLESNAYAGIENLFENERFVEEIRVLKQYEINGYCNYEEIKGKDFAVGYVRGGAELQGKYGDDYVLVPVELPRLEEEDLYEHMFAVSETTSNVGRSIQILSLLNADEDFRNLLLYGVENTHYKKVDTGVENKYGETIYAVERLEKGKIDYLLDVNKTGNAFVAYPLVTDEYDDEQIAFEATRNSWGILQNQEAKVALDLGYNLGYNSSKLNVDIASLKQIRALSDTLLKEYFACETMEEFEAFLVSAKQRTAESEAVIHHTGAVDENGKLIKTSIKNDSLIESYESWLAKKKIKKS